MKVIRRLNELRREIELLQKRGKTVGFVPTMGAFHEGHLSLIRRAAGETDAAVVSLFVNPIQFDEAKDLRSYPRPWRKDLRLAARAGAKLLFAPTAAEMYPPGFQTFVEVEKLGRLLEGQFRPGHFRGVATVVAKLFHLVQPDVAYFGQKDAQQARLVERMIRDLNFPVRLKVLPTLREKDGLPLSSRNRFLSSEARRSSRALAEALQEARRLIECDEPRASLVVRRMKGILRKHPGVKVEYCAIVDPSTLEKVSRIQGAVRALVALRIGGVRLIDNARMKPRKRSRS